MVVKLIKGPSLKDARRNYALAASQLKPDFKAA